MPFTLEEHVSSQTSLTKTGFTQKLGNANECGFNMTEKELLFFCFVFWENINWKYYTKL